MRAHQLESHRNQLAQQLDNAETALAAARTELKVESNLDEEAVTYSRATGLPFAAARDELAGQKRAAAEAARTGETDALRMSKEEFRDHCRRRGLPL